MSARVSARKPSAGRGRRSVLGLAGAWAGLALAGLGSPGCATSPPAVERQRDATAPDRMGALRQPGPPRRVVLISVAGLQSTDFLDAWGHVASAGERVRMPRLAELAREGVVGEHARPPAPGSTYASHATIVTGQLPARHGVVADSSLDETGSRALPFWDNRLLRSSALWDAAIGRGVLALGWPTTSGARIELLVPDSRPTDPTRSWLEHLDREASPGLVDRLRAIAVEAGVDVGGRSTADSAREESRTRDESESEIENGENEASSSGRSRSRLSWPTPAERDAAFAELACHVAASERDPGLWLIRLSQTAQAFRSAGSGSEQADAALARADEAIGRVLDCLAAEEQLIDTAIVVVGDVAYRPVHIRVDPNAALVAAGLVGRDPRSSTGVRSWLALARSNGRSAYVYARDAGRAVEARSVLEAEASRTGAFEVVTAAALARAGADPQAWFGLHAREGYLLGDELLGPVLRPAELRSAAGSLPFREGRAASVGFVAWGRGIRRQVRVPDLTLADIAPTIAALLGLRLDDDLAGDPLIGILRAAVPPPPPGPKRLGIDFDGDRDRVIRDLGGSRPEESSR